MMMQDNFSNAQYAGFAISKDREHQEIKRKLYQEFSNIDADHNNEITYDEIVEYFRVRVSMND